MSDPYIEIKALREHITKLQLEIDILEAMLAKIRSRAVNDELLKEFIDGQVLTSFHGESAEG